MNERYHAENFLLSKCRHFGVCSFGRPVSPMLSLPRLRMWSSSLSLIIPTLSTLAQSGITAISTVGGNVTSGHTRDVSGEGTATAAQLNYPLDVAVDAAGNLYISDSSYDR